MKSEDTWLIPSSCLPLSSSIELGVSSNVYSYRLEANGSIIVHELYKVPSIQLNGGIHDIIDVLGIL